MKNRTVIYLFIIFVFSGLLSSCFLKKETTKQITEIVYSFGDSSVPPKYHRSYSIKANMDSISIVVDSYGDILCDTSYTLSEEQFKELVNYTKECEINNKKEIKKEDDCTGGTSKSIGIYNDDAELVYGTVYKCGGRANGTLDGDVDKFASFIILLIPNFSKHLE
jgi:hypothetical protein